MDAAQAAAHAMSAKGRRAVLGRLSTCNDSGGTGRNSFRYRSNCSSSRIGTAVLLGTHGLPQLGQRVAVARSHSICTDTQNFSNLRERQLTPDMKDSDFSLVSGKSPQSASQVQFCGVVSIRRLEPGAFWVESKVTPTSLSIV